MLNKGIWNASVDNILKVCEGLNITVEKLFSLSERSNERKELKNNNFFEDILFLVGEARAEDIDNIIEGNPDFKLLMQNIYEEINNLMGNGEGSEKIVKNIYDTINLVQNIVYSVAFKDGALFQFNLLNNNSID